MTESETPTNETTNIPEQPATPATEPEAAAPATPATEPEAAAPATPVTEPEAAAPVEINIGGEAVAQEVLEEAPKAPTSGMFWGTGRRKCAVARVRLTPGSGKISVNKREVDDYFSQPYERLAVRESLIATNTEKAFDVLINVGGGGNSGQADAIRLGVARALIKANSRYEPALREKNYLTRDARVVERKKYGQRKARRRFQFSKR